MRRRELERDRLRQPFAERLGGRDSTAQPGGFVADSSVTSLMLQSLETLWELEALHHERGETQESLDTLLCALRCAEALPRTPVDAQYIHAW